VAGCDELDTPATTPPREVSIIPREALFGNPERTQARLSPDGTYISFLAPVGGRLNVHLFQTQSGISSARPITDDRLRSIRYHSWAEDSRHILYTQDKNGDDTWRLYSVDVVTRQTRDLTPFDNVQAQLIGMSPDEPNHILVALNDRDRSWPDVYRIDLRDATRTLVFANTGKFESFLADRQNRVRLGVKRHANGSVTFHAIEANGATRQVLEAPFEDSQTTQPLAFLRDGQTLLMIDSIGRDKAALRSLNLVTGKTEVLGENERADVSDVLLDPVTGEAQAFASDYLQTEWVGRTRLIRDILTSLRAKLNGDLPQIVSRTRDDRLWIVVNSSPTSPAQSLLYDSKLRGEPTALFAQRPQLAEAPLQPMIPTEIDTRDGHRMVSYLTLPPGLDPERDGVPTAPQAMVILVHGGPWSRDKYGFNAEHQWLANRGYAVLSVNYRGSTGFGRAFVNLGNEQWGAKMQDDLMDARAWAIQRGIARPDKIAIFGASYGGYAALTGLTRDPDAFACGVSLVGPSNLLSLFDSIMPEWETYRAELNLRVGDPSTPAGRATLTDRSPLTHASKIKRPLLIAHGANDRRAPLADADALVTAMQSVQAPVTYLVYRDEGHGFANPTNRISFQATAETFLQNCLGGRAEPIGRDFEGAQIEVRAGADATPGLRAALEALPRTTSLPR
jgi:dipeptidyl aminopeptidase/acylaminoacyl peptidase